MGPSWCRGLRLLLVASLLVLSSAAAAALQHPPSPPEPSTADELLARMCDPRGAHPVPPSLCHGLHLRRRRVVEAAGHRRHEHHRHHHRPVPVSLPPPGHDGSGEEIDPRYGVAKRLVPTGPNPLHN
ncbi:hypothetical protein HU200_026771 [Digitaria exilis]|uniref:Uncharacterized protein n=1 Tax=Digitaria exilis TaxID=1010633 RepID=A0A835BUR7_9POAL|nr:hypothetical protein HU200_026771 [Digitaria exilis]